MAEEVKMTKDNMDIWFEKQGFTKVHENEDLVEYRKYCMPVDDSKYEKDIILIIYNGYENPNFFEYLVTKYSITYPGYTKRCVPIRSDELEHLRIKANILMKKFMKDTIEAEKRHIPGHSPLGDCTGFKR